jgi:hypothetical protein
MSQPVNAPTPPVIGLVPSEAATREGAAPRDADIRGPEGRGAAPSTSMALHRELQRAERVLFFAIEAGVDVGDEVRNSIIGAATTPDAQRTPASAAGLLSAITKLNAAVRPVTADSLVACQDSKRVESVVKSYRRVAVFLAIFIIPISLITFVTTSISEAMMKDIDAANVLAVKLSDEIGPPGSPPAAGTRIDPGKLPRGVKEFDVIRDLQVFAATARAIDARARQLDVFVLRMVEDPFKEIRRDTEKTRTKFELPSDLPNLSAALSERISVYQEVRYFAQSVRELISTVYGAIAAGVLPVMYALLGACAYLLRMYQEQVKSRTFTGSDTHAARFVIAAIGGGVVGLFKNFTVGDGASISPLAIAFLVGYAVDVFFAFLDSFVQAFNRGAGASAPKNPAR